MQVTIHAAKTQLSQLIDAVLAGDEVIMTKDGKPVAKLLALAPKPYRLGSLEGQIPRPPDDFFDPMDEQALRDWE